jgi:hypothetical protein
VRSTSSISARHLEQAERDGREDQRLQAGEREQAGAPDAEIDDLAAPERGQDVEPDRKDVDEQDADQEGRHGYAHQRYRQEEFRQPAVAVDAGVDAHGNAERDGEQGRGQRQLDGGRQALGDEAHDRLLHLIGDAEIEACGVADKAGKLNQDGVVQTELAADGFAVLDGGILADHLVDGIADVAEQGERDQGDNEQDHQGLEQAPDGKSQHGVIARWCAARTVASPWRILTDCAAKGYCFLTHAKRMWPSARCTTWMFFATPQVSIC